MSNLPPSDTILLSSVYVTVNLLTVEVMKLKNFTYDETEKENVFISTDKKRTIQARIKIPE